MKTTDSYHKWVEWSEEDGVSIGSAPTSSPASTAMIRCGCTPIWPRSSRRLSPISNCLAGSSPLLACGPCRRSAERARLGRTGHLGMPDFVGVAARHRDAKYGGGRPAGTCRLEAAPAKIQR